MQPRVILVATDFEESRDTLLDHTEALARLYGAEVQLVHAQPSFWKNWISSGLTDRQAADRLNRWAEALSERGVRTSCAPVLRGQVAEAILEHADSQEVGLITIGASNKSGLGRMLGATAEAIARFASQPVWIRRSPTTRLKKVLCGVDGSESSKRALAAAVWISERSGARLTVTCALEDPTPHALGTPPSEVDAAAAAYRKRRAEELDGFVDDAGHGEGVAERRWIWGRPAEALAALVADEGFDLLVIGRAGVGNVRRLLLGSTATRLLREAPCSVLLTSQTD